PGPGPGRGGTTAAAVLIARDDPPGPSVTGTPQADQRAWPGAAAPGSAPSSPPDRHPVTALWPGTHEVSSTTERTRQWPRPCRSRPGSRWTQPGRQPG